MKIRRLVVMKLAVCSDHTNLYMIHGVCMFGRVWGSLNIVGQLMVWIFHMQGIGAYH